MEYTAWIETNSLTIIIKSPNRQHEVGPTDIAIISDRLKVLHTARISPGQLLCVRLPISKSATYFGLNIGNKEMIVTPGQSPLSRVDSIKLFGLRDTVQDQLLEVVHQVSNGYNVAVTQVIGQLAAMMHAL